MTGSKTAEVHPGTPQYPSPRMTSTLTRCPPKWILGHLDYNWGVDISERRCACKLSEEWLGSVQFHKKYVQRKEVSFDCMKTKKQCPGMRRLWRISNRERELLPCNLDESLWSSVLAVPLGQVGRLFRICTKPMCLLDYMKRFFQILVSSKLEGLERSANITLKCEEDSTRQSCLW